MKKIVTFTILFLLVGITMHSPATDKGHVITIEQEYRNALLEKQGLEEKIEFNRVLINKMMCIAANQSQPAARVIGFRVRNLQDENNELRHELVSLRGIIQWHLQVIANQFENGATPY